MAAEISYVHVSSLHQTIKEAIFLLQNHYLVVKNIVTVNNHF